jgi:hypothetical protein
MNLSPAEWCERFAIAVLTLNRSFDMEQAAWLAKAVYPSAFFLEPEDAASKLVGRRNAGQAGAESS